MGIHLNQIPKEVRERLGLKNPPLYQQFWATIGDKQPIYFRSSWEYYYAIFLEKLKREKKIIDWFHEPKTFWFQSIKRGNVSYLPDFQILHIDGTEEWVECKGFMCADSRTKISRFKKYYPNHKLRVVDKDWFKQNMKACKAIENQFAKVVHPQPVKR